METKLCSPQKMRENQRYCSLQPRRPHRVRWMKCRGWHNFSSIIFVSCISGSFCFFFPAGKFCTTVEVPSVVATAKYLCVGVSILVFFLLRVSIFFTTFIFFHQARRKLSCTWTLRSCWVSCSRPTGRRSSRRSRSSCCRACWRWRGRTALPKTARWRNEDSNARSFDTSTEWSTAVVLLLKKEKLLCNLPSD